MIDANKPNSTTSHYLLPEGNVQIAFSGGRTSAFMLHHILNANQGLPPRAVVSFQNTGREMPQTLDFVAEVASRWSVPIVWLEYRPRAEFHPLESPRIAAAYAAAFGDERLAYMRDWWSREASPAGFAIVSHNSASRGGEPFEALILRRMFLPNVMSRFCTIEMKIRTAKRYLVGDLLWKHWTTGTGLRADEPSRLLKAANPTKDRWQNWTPLGPAGVSRRDVATFWQDQPFDLKLPNVGGNCWLGNCDGCFLKAEADVAAFSRELPDRALWWQNAETFMQAIWPSLSSQQRLRRLVAADPELPGKLRDAYPRPISSRIIRMIVDNPRSAGTFSKRYTRAELADFMHRQGDMALSTEGVLCQTAEGECFG